MAMLVYACIKCPNVCLAAIVGLVARVVYTQTQEDGVTKARYYCWYLVDCSVFFVANIADRWSNESLDAGCVAKWMFVWVDFIYPQVEFYFSYKL